MFEEFWRHSKIALKKSQFGVCKVGNTLLCGECNYSTPNLGAVIVKEELC